MNPEAEDITLLIGSRYPLITVETLEEERLAKLLARVAAGLGVPFFSWSRARGLWREDRDRPGAGLQKGAYDTQEPVRLLRHIAALDIDAVYLLADFALWLEDALVARSLREVLRRFTDPRRAIVLSGASIALPSELTRDSVPFRLSLPGPQELRAEVRRVLEVMRRERSVEIELSTSEANALIENMRGLSLDEVERVLYRAVLPDGRLDAADIGEVLRAKQGAVARHGVLEFQPPSGTLARIGGMGHLKAWLEKRRDALTDRARAFGLEAPRGLLLIGVQGCGKSLFARSVAAAWKLPLLRLDPGALYDKYIGETEKNLRVALETVDALAPVVLWIDEIEKGFAAGESTQDGGTSQRALGTFLTWLQEHDSGAFVVATANDVAALPPELLRKGRLDDVFFVDLPDPAARWEIFSAHLARRDREPAAFDLAHLVQASDGFSGAEIEQAVIAGLYTAFAAGGELTTEVLIAELEVAVPLSVTMSERVAALRAWARGRAKPA